MIPHYHVHYVEQWTLLTGTILSIKLTKLNTKVFKGYSGNNTKHIGFVQKNTKLIFYEKRVLNFNFTTYAYFENMYSTVPILPSFTWGHKSMQDLAEIRLLVKVT